MVIVIFWGLRQLRSKRSSTHTSRTYHAFQRSLGTWAGHVQKFHCWCGSEEWWSEGHRCQLWQKPENRLVDIGGEGADKWGAKCEGTHYMFASCHVSGNLINLKYFVFPILSKGVWQLLYIDFHFPNEDETTFDIYRETASKPDDWVCIPYVITRLTSWSQHCWEKWCHLMWCLVTGDGYIVAVHKKVHICFYSRSEVWNDVIKKNKKKNAFNHLHLQQITFRDTFCNSNLGAHRKMNARQQQHLSSLSSSSCRNYNDVNSMEASHIKPHSSGDRIAVN